MFCLKKIVESTSRGVVETTMRRKKKQVLNPLSQWGVMGWGVGAMCGGGETEDLNEKVIKRSEDRGVRKKKEAAVGGTTQGVLMV